MNASVDAEGVHPRAAGFILRNGGFVGAHWFRTPPEAQNRCVLP